MKNNPHFTTPVYDYFGKSKMLRSNLGKNSHFINLDVVSDATIVLLFRLNYVNRKNRQPGPTVELQVNISATDDERRVRVTVTRTDDNMGMYDTARANPTVKYDNSLWCADKADARNLADDIAKIVKQHCKTLEGIEQTKLDGAKKVFGKLNAFLDQRAAEQQKAAEEAAKEAEKVAKLDAEWNELSTKDKDAVLKQHKASFLTQPTKRGRPPKTDKKVQPLKVTLKRGRHPKK